MDIYDSSAGMVVADAIDQMNQRGWLTVQDGKECIFVNDAILGIDHPILRHVSGGVSIPEKIASAFWMMVDSDAQEDNSFLRFFGNVVPMNGTHKSELYRNDQHIRIVDSFNTNIQSGTCLQLNMPSSQPSNEDYNRRVYFDNKSTKDLDFRMKVCQNTGNIFGNDDAVNLFEFTFLQELFYDQIMWDGSMQSAVFGLNELYAVARDGEFGIQQEVPFRTEEFELTCEMYAPCVKDWPMFFTDLVDLYSEAIDSEEPEHDIGKLLGLIGHTFIEYDVSMEGNMLWHYAKVLVAYITEVRGIELNLELNKTEEYLLSLRD